MNLYEYQPAASNLTIFANENVTQLTRSLLISTRIYAPTRSFFFFSSHFPRFRFPVYNPLVISFGRIGNGSTRGAPKVRGKEHQQPRCFPCREQLFPESFPRGRSIDQLHKFHALRFDYVTWRIIDRDECGNSNGYGNTYRETRIRTVFASFFFFFP